MTKWLITYPDGDTVILNSKPPEDVIDEAVAVVQIKQNGRLGIKKHND